MGEQGAEGIHAALNKITPNYLNLHEKEQVLRCTVLEHHRQICPILAECKPAPKKRKFKKDMEQEETTKETTKSIT